MRYCLMLLFALFIVSNLDAQQISYRIYVPNGAYGGLEKLAEEIDSTHYYTHREIRYRAEPENGWSDFYERIRKLSYPEKAKIKKQQASMVVFYKVNEKGIVDSVYVERYSTQGKWSKCSSCEALIMDLIEDSKWKPGRIGDVSVKTIDFLTVHFEIHDPNAEKEDSDFNPFNPY